MHLPLLQTQVWDTRSLCTSCSRATSFASLQQVVAYFQWQTELDCLQALGRALAPALTQGNEPLPEAVQAAAAQALADFCDLSEKDLVSPASGVCEKGKKKEKKCVCC